MAYEGVDIKDAWGRPIGLRVKNGVIQNEPNFDIEAIRLKINGFQVKQEWTIAKEKAREAARGKRRQHGMVRVFQSYQQRCSVTKCSRLYHVWVWTNNMITLYFRSVDELDGWTEECETVEEAASQFLYQMGKPYDIGRFYAVNTYGDVTCTLEGATWKELGLAQSRTTVFLHDGDTCSYYDCNLVEQLKMKSSVQIVQLYEKRLDAVSTVLESAEEGTWVFEYWTKVYAHLLRSLNRYLH